MKTIIELSKEEMQTVKQAGKIMREYGEAVFAIYHGYTCAGQSAAGAGNYIETFVKSYEKGE